MTHQSNNEDEQYRNAVKNLVSQIEIPDGEVPWNNIQNRMNAEMRSRKIRRMMLTVSAVASSILIVSSVIPASSVQANPISTLLKLVKKAQNGATQILYGKEVKQDSKNAKTAPPPDLDLKPIIPATGESTNILSEEVSIEQANKMLDFPILFPKLLPKNFELRRIRVFKDPDGKYRNGTLEYSDDKDIIILSQKRINQGSGWKTTINDAAGKIETLQINRFSVTVVHYTEGGIHMEWLSDDILYELHSKLEFESLVDFVKSIE
ncbi:DUF4367 domain-containing protein [Paenibacillus sp. WC2504]|uniref:DUF4367 domain-containing protein n=1 Tax=Paenibacillus sp. WC2504 TaxID=3461403 RepID=UPI0040457F7B